MENIIRFMNYCKTVEIKEDVLYDQVIIYFKVRNTYSYFLNEKELRYFSEFVNGLKKVFKSEKKKNKVLFQARSLLLMSLDKQDGTKYYKRLKEIESKQLWQINEQAFYERLSIIFDKAMECASVIVVIDNIRLFLNNNSSIEARKKVISFLKNYSFEKWPREDKIQIEKFIKRLKKEINVNVGIENKLLEELEKSIINYSLIEEYLTQLEDNFSDGISSNNLKVIKKIYKLLFLDNHLNFQEEHLDNYNLLFERLKKLCRSMLQQSNDVSYIDFDLKLREKIVAGEVFLYKQIPDSLLVSINATFDDLDFATEPRIITIDEAATPDKDGAFSIQKIGDTYLLNVYVVDVPTFLRNNIGLSRFAYEMGNSLYVRMGNGNYNIDMIPELYSHKILSLHKGYPVNSIAFEFVFGTNGDLYSRSISRKKIIVTDDITPVQLKQVLSSSFYQSELQTDLKNYQYLCKVVAKKSKDEFLKQLDFNKVDNLVAFPSILVNYYLGYEAEFAIYRENGSYTNKYFKNPYTHSATPLRKFVSDINLAYFLNQKGIVSFSEKDLGYIEKNIDEIIEHLNERDQIQKFIERNPSFVRKYIKSK